MKQLVLAKALSFFQRRKDTLSMAWESAEPISLEELKTHLATLVLDQLPEKSDARRRELDALTFEQLWSVFETLEDLDDCSVIS